MNLKRLTNTVKKVFSKKITIFRWQLSIFGVFCMLTGLSIGTFFGVKNLVKIFATNDTYQTWYFNSSTVNDYQYDSSLIEATQNSVTVANSVSNGSYDSNLLGWSGYQPYQLDDQFSGTLSAGSLNDTQATDGINTRTVTDTGSYLSINEGLIFAGNSSTTEGDPGIHYGVLDRSVGLSLFSSFVSNGGNSKLGFSFNGSGGTSNVFYITSNGDLYLQGNDDTYSLNVGNYTGKYSIGVTLTNSGAYYFLQGGDYSNWTFLGYVPGDSSTVYPGLYNKSSASLTADYISIPQVKYLPTPLAYDSFTRSDNSYIGNSESVGPDSQSLSSSMWNANFSWSILSNKLVSNWSSTSNISGLVSNWKLDESSGSTTVDSVSRISANVVGASIVSGRTGYARSFAGGANYVLTAGSPLRIISNWTIEAWIKPSNLSQDGFVVFNGNDGGGYGFAVSGGSNSGDANGNRLKLIFGGVGWADCGYAFTDTTTWHHIVVTRDTTTARCYVDGNITTGSTTMVSRAVPDIMTIGTQLNSSNGVNTGRSYKGLVDDVKMYNRVLTAQEIKREYLSTNPNSFITTFQNTPSVVETVNLSQVAGPNMLSGLVTNLDNPNNPANFLLAYYDGANIHLDKASSDTSLLSNLISNGGFENAGDPRWSGWTEDMDQGSGSISDETSFVHSGNHAAKLVGDEYIANSKPRIGYTISVIPGNSYSFSFWTRGDGTNAGKYSILDASNSIYLEDSRSTGVFGTEFSNVGSVFTAPLNCNSVVLFLMAPSVAGGTAYFDDVSVTPLASNLVYTSLLNSSVSYVAGAPLTVVTDGSTEGHLKISVYYNYNLVGTQQDITDERIITNTNHGIFSTGPGNTFDDYTLYARGLEGEYSDIPAENLDVSRETSLTYSGDGSSKLTSGSTEASYLQAISLEDAKTYSFSTYAYVDGGQVTNEDLSLYYNGSNLNTVYTETSKSGWYKLTGVFTAVEGNTYIGVKLKAGKTLYIDETSLYKQGIPEVYTDTYSNPQMKTLDSFDANIVLSGNSSVSFQLCPNDGSICESGDSWLYYNGSSWENATNTSTDSNTKEQLTKSVMQSFPTENKKVSVKAILTVDSQEAPTISSISIGMTTDITPPINGDNIVFNRNDNVSCTYDDDCWSNETTPEFTWSDGSDDNSGVQGYCLYFGTDEEADPATSKGMLASSPEDLGNSTCQFIVSSPNIDLSNSGLLSTTLSNTQNFVTAPNTYYLNVKTIDNANNVATDSLTIRFRFDGNRPNNVSYISTPSGNFSSVDDMSFTWPRSTANDSESGVLGFQYQINSTTGEWKGTEYSDSLGINYIPFDQSSYNLDQEENGGSIVSGNNVIYFRTVDNVGNVSQYVSGGLSFGGQAPNFGTEDKVAINPTNSDTNSFSISWPEATSSIGAHVSHYYYMVNTSPASTLSTLQGNSATYIDNGTSTSVNTRSLPNVNKGTNTIYVVAIDDEEVPNYSPSSYITGTFTLNSSNPDNVSSLVATDSSIKAKQQWNVTLTYTSPEYEGAGNLIYQVMRSEDGTNYRLVGNSIGLSYVDNVPESKMYYYKIYTKDGANAMSSGTNAVNITPTGRWLTAPEMITEPKTSNIATRKATVYWTTDRVSDSKIAFGTKSLDYGKIEPSSSDKVTGHSIVLSGLEPNTTYYYVAKWTDEDGNTGTSEELSFQTAPAPTIKNVLVDTVGLSSGIVHFTSVGASKVKIYYGPTTSFGGVQEIYTSAEESNLTVQLSGLNDGTKYYYKINTFDSDMNEYDGTVLDFTTLPKPKISEVKLQEVSGTAQTTVLVSWISNTDISSIITYYPEDKPSQSADQVDVKMISGKHEMTIKGLIPQTKYVLVVKGVDKIGNMALSDSQRFTTATDTRPPEISNLVVQGQIVSALSGSEEATAQLIISWDTDEPATSQVEFGEGSGSSYSQRTQRDENLTYNHTVVISGLTSSTVYHLRTISLDSVGNLGNSIDTVTISPKATDSALNLVINNLIDIFGFLRK